MKFENIVAMQSRVSHEVRQHGDSLRLFCVEPGQGGDLRHFILVEALPDFRPAFCWRCGSMWPDGPKFNAWIHDSPCESCHGLGCKRCVEDLDG